MRKRFEAIRIAYRDKVGGKVKGLDTEWLNFKRQKDYEKKLVEIELRLHSIIEFYSKIEARYTPMLSTFINQQRWLEFDSKVERKPKIYKFNELTKIEQSAGFLKQKQIIEQNGDVLIE